MRTDEGADDQFETPNRMDAGIVPATWIGSLSDAQLIRTIMDNSQDTIYFKDRMSRFILNSKAHANQFGVDDPKELVGKSDRDFYPEEFIRQTLEDERRILETGVPIVGRVEKLENDDGSVTWFLASKYPLYDDKGRIVGTWGTSRNITGLKQAEQELENLNILLAEANARLRELSVIDDLSGLYNRRNFQDILAKTARSYIRRRTAGVTTTFCLALMDVDHFKTINDTYGHVVGDAVIRYVADVITATVRPSDHAFRYGGDEFAVIFPDMTLEEARSECERLREEIESQPFVRDGLRITLTMSIGISEFEFERDTKDLIHRADCKLYLSKRNGRNRVS